MDAVHFCFPPLTCLILKDFFAVLEGIFPRLKGGTEVGIRRRVVKGDCGRYKGWKEDLSDRKKTLRGGQQTLEPAPKIRNQLV